MPAVVIEWCCCCSEVTCCGVKQEPVIGSLHYPPETKDLEEAFLSLKKLYSWAGGLKH